MSDMGSAFREASANSVLLYVQAQEGATLDAIDHRFRTWPRHRVLQAVLRLHLDGRVALRFYRGDVTEVHPIPDYAQRTAA